MVDLGHVRSEGERFTKSVGELLEIELTPEVAMRLFLALMGKVRSELYRVVLFYGEEADKCRETGAFFSCCLMTASAIEALLTVLCLTCRKEIEHSAVYKNFKRGKGFEEKILSADFQNYIDVASDLGWVPSGAVSSEVFKAAILDLPLVVKNLYPNLSPNESNAMADRFKKQPGIEMLRYLQHMRNLVHGSRWARLGVTVQTSEFESDCKFIFVIANEVMGCLISTFCKLAAEGIANANEIKNKLSPETWTLFRQQVQEISGIKSNRE